MLIKRQEECNVQTDGGISVEGDREGRGGRGKVKKVVGCNLKLKNVFSLLLLTL